MKCFKGLILLICFLFGSFNAIGQIRYSFIKDTVSINGGETFSNLLRVINPYQQNVLLTQADKGLPKGLINLPDSIKLNGGETRTFPVKYMADRQTINRNIQLFGLRLVTADPAVQVQQAAVFITQLEDVKGLTIDTEESEIYLSQLTNQVQVMIRCANNGFVPITFKLLLNGIPDGLEFTGQTMTLTLQPGAQQLLPFLARNKSSRTAGDYTVTIQAVDERNAQLAVKVIRILNVTSARRMASGQFGGDIPNTVSLRYVSLDSRSSYEEFQGNGKLAFGENRFLEYRVNANRFQQPGYNGVNIFNTYVDYQTKSWGLKFGNIYENVDFNLGGRGFKASAKLKNKAVLSIYGIESNYMLFTQLAQTAINRQSGAKTIAVDYYIEKGGREDRRLTYVRNNDELNGIHADQLSGKAGIKLKDKSFLGLEGGLSSEFLSLGAKPGKIGFSGGVNYTQENDQIQLYGNLYYSSPYYTGLRRGNLTSDVSILHKLGSANSIRAHVSIQQANPKFQDNPALLYTRSINKNAIGIYEIQYTTNIGKLGINAGTYLMKQQLMGVSFIDVPPAKLDWKSSSIHFVTNLNYNGQVHNFSLIADYGYTFMNTSEKPPAPFNSLKMNASYNVSFLGFTSYIQFNPYYLSDLIAAGKTVRYRLYSFGPNAHFNSFNNKLNTQIGGAYNYYGFSQSNNYAMTGSCRYAVKGNWAFSFDAQYSLSRQSLLPVPGEFPQGNSMAATNNVQFNSRQLRVGVEKQFGIKRSASNKKLELAYFEDHNSNGIQDAGEAAVAGILVKINGEAALTNSKGLVIFKNMNNEVYTASVTNTKGWSLQQPTTVLLDKSRHIAVPLVKTQALNGKLKLVAEKYLDTQPVLAGIRVNARDANGVVHQTLTDETGAFCFYLPRNNYTVYIETEGMSFSIQNGREEVVLQGTPVEMLTFLYKDERRKVGVTHF